MQLCRDSRADWQTGAEKRMRASGIEAWERCPEELHDLWAAFLPLHSQAKCFPKEPGNSKRKCATPRGTETKAEQEKRLPFTCPSQKEHSFWEARLSGNGVSLARDREQVRILRNSHKRRVGIVTICDKLDINYEKGNRSR